MGLRGEQSGLRAGLRASGISDAGREYAGLLIALNGCESKAGRLRQAVLLPRRQRLCLQQRKGPAGRFPRRVAESRFASPRAGSGHSPKRTSESPRSLWGHWGRGATPWPPTSPPCCPPQGPNGKVQRRAARTGGKLVVIGFARV